MIGQSISQYRKLYPSAVALGLDYLSNRRKFQYASGTRSTTMRKKPKNRSINSLKTAIKKTEPAFHSTSESIIGMTHNTIYSACPTQGIVQGDTNANGRTGDEIYICSLKINGSNISSVAAGAYTYRVLVGWCTAQAATANIATTLVSGLGSTDIFLPNGSNVYGVNQVVNPKAFTCLYDQTFDINSTITNTNDVFSFSTSIPINQSFKYRATQSVFGKNKNLYIVLVSTVYAGTTGTTSTGAQNLSWDLIYKQ